MFFQSLRRRDVQRSQLTKLLKTAETAVDLRDLQLLQETLTNIDNKVNMIKGLDEDITNTIYDDDEFDRLYCKFDDYLIEVSEIVCKYEYVFEQSQSQPKIAPSATPVETTTKTRRELLIENRYGLHKLTDNRQDNIGLLLVSSSDLTNETESETLHLEEMPSEHLNPNNPSCVSSTRVTNTEDEHGESTTPQQNSFTETTKRRQLAPTSDCVLRNHEQFQDTTNCNVCCECTVSELITTTTSVQTLSQTELTDSHADTSENIMNFLNTRNTAIYQSPGDNVVREKSPHTVSTKQGYTLWDATRAVMMSPPSGINHANGMAHEQTPAETGANPSVCLPAGKVFGFESGHRKTVLRGKDSILFNLHALAV